MSLFVSFGSFRLFQKSVLFQIKIEPAGERFSTLLGGPLLFSVLTLLLDFPLSLVCVHLVLVGRRKSAARPKNSNFLTAF